MIDAQRAAFKILDPSYDPIEGDPINDPYNNGYAAGHAAGFEDGVAWLKGRIESVTEDWDYWPSRAATRAVEEALGLDE
jgi:hypothetical protein